MNIYRNTLSKSLVVKQSPDIIWREHDIDE